MRVDLKAFNHALNRLSWVVKKFFCVVFKKKIAKLNLKFLLNFQAATTADTTNWPSLSEQPLVTSPPASVSNAPASNSKMSKSDSVTSSDAVVNGSKSGNDSGQEPEGSKENKKNSSNSEANVEKTASTASAAAAAAAAEKKKKKGKF